MATTLPFLLAVSSLGAMGAMGSPPEEFLLPNDQPMVNLDAKTAFETLSKQEQFYAHYLSQASFYGGLIALLQTSPEAPQLFRLVQRLVVAEKTEELKEKALKVGITEEEYTAFIVYCSGIYNNMGNYKSFGDSKFVPNVTADKFEQIIHSSAAFEKDKANMENIWQSVKVPMYSLGEKDKYQGFWDKGVTGYFSDNIDKSDSDKIDRFLKTKGIEAWNTRAFKTGKDGKVKYEIRSAATESKVELEEEFEGAIFEVTTGDYANLLGLVNTNLQLARQYASNEVEREMLAAYARSFHSGNIGDHKDGSRLWIRDISPAVETYIGFIETYRDPAGQRGEFEGFVALVNREESAKYSNLVNKAESFLAKLPWPKEFEKDVFLRPDFTSIDVLTFAGGKIPAGINIPNYDEIRQSEGFKNVNLGNVVSSSYKVDANKTTTFVSKEDHELLKKYRVPSFQIQVGLHELLGHGSGKQFYRYKNGTQNYPTNLADPLNPGNTVQKHYEEGETFNSKFGNLGSAVSECKAEAVGLYLSLDKEVLAIFSNTTDINEEEDLKYANWLNLCLSALKGLESYVVGSNNDGGEWKQAHSWGRFAILNVLLEAGQGLANIKEVVNSEDGKPDLLMTVDRTKLESVGKPAVGEFLKKLQVYTSTGDVDAAKKLFDHLTGIKGDGPYPFAKWREIVLNRRTPRKMFVQANTVVKDEQVVHLEYDPNPAGMMRSWAERFPAEEYKVIDAYLEELYLKDKPFFQSKS